MKKETKQKIKTWCAETLPFVALAGGAFVVMTVSFTKYMEQDTENRKAYLEGEREDRRQAYVDYLRNALEREFETHHTED